MPARIRRPAVYNTPTIRNGGFGVLQIEAIHNRPLSIARRHLAASELRMRAIEPTELSSSEWVRFLVMEDPERERFISYFLQHRRGSASSSSSAGSSAEGGRGSVEMDGDVESAAEAPAIPSSLDKAEEARLEAEEAAREEERVLPMPIVAMPTSPVSPPATPAQAGAGATPPISLWARQFDTPSEGATEYSARRPRHARRAVTDSIIEAPPTYDAAVRSRTPPPAYEPRRGGRALRLGAVGE